MKSLLVTLSACLLLVSGCGNDGQDTATGADAAPPAESPAATAAGSKTTAGAGEGCVVPGDELAAALGAELVAVNPMTAPESQTRCTYEVTDASGAGQVFVLWTMPPEDFYPLKDVEEDLTGDVAGLGDAAFIAYHSEDQRYDVYALAEGKITIEVTGSDEAAVKQVAELALAKY